MWRVFFIALLGCLPMAVWAYSAGIEARVLPNEEANILTVEHFEIKDLGENQVSFDVKTNLPAQVKLLYGPTWQKELTFELPAQTAEHYFTIEELRPATLYYYRLYLFNDNDSISLGDQVFKTAGQPRIDWLDSTSAPHEPAYKAQNSVAPVSSMVETERPQSAITGDLFSIADLAFLLLCLSIFLLLLAIIKHYKREIKG
ncbi:MAG TPA: hypothetical protein PL066_03555 [bacterium]|nr:hypothetical protein [bacterium]